jgi:hypothetical protein
MKARKFNTVNDLSNVKAENKTAKYFEMVKAFAKEAGDLLNENKDSFLLGMAFQEIMQCFRKAESADCEYTVYANAHAAEVWLEKMVTRKF